MAKEQRNEKEVTSITIESLLSDKITQEHISAASFEDGIKLLEEVVGAVEAGALPLEKAIGAYEKGSLLVNHLRRLLSGAEEKLRVLQSTSAV